jgi:hypothetical protein
MKIVLGIYRTHTFYTQSQIEGHCAYPFTEIDPDIIYIEGILNKVIEASVQSSGIIFCIDSLLPNITGMEDSYTCRELINVISEPTFLEKTVWMENCEEVTHQYVVNKLNLGNRFI